MRKLFLALLAAISLVAGAQASTNVFNSNEVGPTVFGAFNTTTKEVGVGVGLDYFPLQKYVGIEASTVFYDLKGQAFDNVDGVALIRYPFEIQRIAPVGVVGVHHDFGTDKTELVAGARLSYRANDKWGVWGGYERLVESQKDVVKVGIDLRF